VTAAVTRHVNSHKYLIFKDILDHTREWEPVREPNRIDE
jgi:hypothetical protein